MKAIQAGRAIRPRIQNYEDLPQQAKSYLSQISQQIGRDISIVSTGPNRAETIIMEESPRLQGLFPTSL